MNALIYLHNSAFEKLETILGPWLLPTLARFTFAATLLIYFWKSALTKIGDGVFGIFDVSGAYGQMFPHAFEVAGYDDELMSSFHWLVALAGTWGEFILPLMIVIGLFTRISAIGMIIFVAVQTLTDLYGHGVIAETKTLGAWFDKDSASLIMDQRLFWITILLILVVRGAGPLSIDRLLGRHA